MAEQLRPHDEAEAEKQMQELTARWEEVDDHGDK